MISERSINPENKQQARVFFSYTGAYWAGVKTHAQKAMRKLADEHGFRIIESIPQFLSDGWDFWIEFDSAPSLPGYVNCDLPWKPVGQV